MKKYFVLWSMFLVLFTMSTGLTMAQERYPSKPIKVIITYPPGGGTDLFVRALQDKAEQILGKRLILEYKPGLSGAIALAQLKDMKPDGYTIAAIINTGISIAPNLVNVGYDPVRDFSYINLLVLGPHAMTCSMDAPWNTVAEFVSDARKNKEGINFCSSGVGSTGHLSMAMFAREAKIKLNHVPMAGGAGATTALLGGHMKMGVITNQDEYVRTNRLKLLAYVTQKRGDAFPKVPSLTELGYNVDVQIWYGFCGPKGMQKDIVDKLDTAFHQASQDPEVKKKLEKLALVTTHMSGQELQEKIAEEFKVNGEAIRSLGLKKEYEEAEAKKKK